MENPAYALGHSAGELERLSIQSRFVGPITREFFREAGSVPVCASSMLAAALVTLRS